MNGWRIDMEDKVLVEYDASADFGVFGVFDGHGDGGHASDYVAKNLRGRLMARPEWTSAYRSRDPGLLASLIASACYDLDEGLRGDASRPTRDGGTTAIIALVCDRHLIVANVGDSRCILARKKKREEDMSAIEVVPMLEDHRRPPRQEVGHQFSECVPRLRRLQLQVERRTAAIRTGGGLHARHRR